MRRGTQRTKRIAGPVVFPGEATVIINPIALPFFLFGIHAATIRRCIAVIMAPLESLKSP